MKCARCDHEIRAESGVKGTCEVCGEPICYRCVMLDHATRCAEHESVEVTRGEVCAVCGTGGLTALNSASCREKGCHKRVCNACLAVGLWSCTKHATGDQRATTRHAIVEPIEPSRLVTCSICGRRTPPALIGRRCAEPGCNQAICLTCAKSGAQRCGLHLGAYVEPRPLIQPPTVDPVSASGLDPSAKPSVANQPKPMPVTEPAKSPPRVCTRCGVPLALRWDVFCERDGCEQPLCRACAEGVFPLCKKHLHEWLVTLRKATEAEAPDPDAAQVTAAQARLRVVNFFNRLQHRMSQPQQLTMPDGREVQFAGWREPSWARERDDLAELALEVWGAACDVRSLDAIPLRRIVRYELAPRTWSSLGMRRRRAVIEARSVADTPRFLIWGHDWEPADLIEILGEVEAAAQAADECGYFHLLVLFSPTGWSERSIQAVAGDTPDERLLFRSLRIALAGPRVGDLTFSVHDDRLGELDELLCLETDEERLASLADRLRVYLESNLRSGVALAEAMETLGVNDATAREVFDRLCANGRFELLDGEADGPMLAHR